jgi:hypothetical protein
MYLKMGFASNFLDSHELSAIRTNMKSEGQRRARETTEYLQNEQKTKQLWTQTTF